MLGRTLLFMILYFFAPLCLLLSSPSPERGEPSHHPSSTSRGRFHSMSFFHVFFSFSVRVRQNLNFNVGAPSWEISVTREFKTDSSFLFRFGSASIVLLRLSGCQDFSTFFVQTPTTPPSFFHSRLDLQGCF